MKNMIACRENTILKSPVRVCLIIVPALVNRRDSYNYCKWIANTPIVNDIPEATFQMTMWNYSSNFTCQSFERGLLGNWDLFGGTKSGLRKILGARP